MKPRVTLFFSILVSGLLSMTFTDARAACTCVCVDGLNRPLCASAGDIRPLCPPRVCPRDPAVTRPLDQLVEPPPRDKTCNREYTYNRYSGRYEWRILCR